mgnify:CR=1 FL=1
MMTQNGIILHYSEPKSFFSNAKNWMVSLGGLFSKKAFLEVNASEELGFGELNPLLAKELTEVEAQLGQLAMIQYEMIEERRRMHSEMNAIKSLVLANASA